MEKKKEDLKGIERRGLKIKRERMKKDRQSLK
jgi:hypothetical protein